MGIALVSSRRALLQGLLVGISWVQAQHSPWSSIGGVRVAVGLQASATGISGLGGCWVLLGLWVNGWPGLRDSSRRISRMC